MSDKTNHQRRRYAAEHKFARFAELNGLVDLGGENAKDGRRAKKKAAESWTKRNSNNATGFHKPTKAAPVTVRRGA